MSTWSDDYRTVEYWPDKTDTRVIFAIKRTPENDQQTDEELIAACEPWRIQQQTEREEQRHLRVVDDPE